MEPVFWLFWLIWLFWLEGDCVESAYTLIHIPHKDQFTFPAHIEAHLIRVCWGSQGVRVDLDPPHFIWKSMCHPRPNVGDNLEWICREPAQIWTPPIPYGNQSALHTQMLRTMQRGFARSPHKLGPPISYRNQQTFPTHIENKRSSQIIHRSGWQSRVALGSLHGICIDIDQSAIQKSTCILHTHTQGTLEGTCRKTVQGWIVPCSYVYIYINSHSQTHVPNNLEGASRES